MVSRQGHPWMHFKAALIFLIFCAFHVNAAGCGGSSSTYTIQNQADAQVLGSCTVFTGSVAIATGVAGTINIPDVLEITGDLNIQFAPNITAISADSLRHLDGMFSIADAQQLSTINFPELTTIGNISWSGLPNTNTLNFSSGISTASIVSIQSTFLQSLTGLNIRTVDSILISNNHFLQQISIPLTSVVNSLMINNNGDSCQLDLSRLTTVGDISISELPSLALPSLGYISGSFVLAGNSFSNITADNLNVIKKDFTLTENPLLTSMVFPGLLSVGQTFSSYNNSNVTSIKLGQMATAGAINISGPLKEFDVPVLKTVNGSFSILSSDASFNCSTFNALDENSGIKGIYSCNGEQHSPHSPLSSSPSNGNDANSKKISSQAIAGIVAGIAIAMLILGLSLFWYRRSQITRKAEQEAVTNPEIQKEDPVEMDGAKAHPTELATGMEFHEMPEQHGINEAPEQLLDCRHELPGQDHKLRDS